MMRVSVGTVIGIDSKTTKIAATISRGPDEKPTLRVSTIPKGLDMATKCLLAQRFVRELVLHASAENTPVYVFIEEPLVGRGIKSSLQLAKIEGACMAGAQSVDHATRSTGPIAVYEVNVQTWKRVVVGAGNAGKETVAAWVSKYWGQAFDIIYDMSPSTIDQDLCDATAICYYGMRTLRLSNNLQPPRYPVGKRVARTYITSANRQKRLLISKRVKRNPKI